MAKKQRIPGLVHHKPTDQARVRIDGKDHYLGKWDDPQVRGKYEQLIAEWLERKQASGASTSTPKTLNSLLLEWWGECKRRYTRGKGKLGGAQNWRPTIKLLREAFGEEHPDNLSPKRLKRLLEQKAGEKGWSKTYTRDHLQRIKTLLKWAVGEELVKPDTLARIKAIELRHGKVNDVAGPVPDELVEKTLPQLPHKIACMVQIQRLTGMRPSEVCEMRPEQIDRSDDVWTYTPATHKTSHKGKRRTVFLGPKSQQILAPWLVKAGDGYVFPARGHKTPYTADSYRQAIVRICRKHKLAVWTPYQLRKSCAQQIRNKLDVEMAAAALGHSSSQVTQDYYARDTRERGIAVAKLLG